MQAVTIRVKTVPALVFDLRLALLAAVSLLLLAALAVWPDISVRPAAYVQQGRFIVTCCLYLAIARASLLLGNARLRAVSFALANLAVIVSFIDSSRGRRMPVFFVAAYLAMAGFHYAMLRLFAWRDGRWPWLAFFSPIAALAAVRYAPFTFSALLPGIPAPAVFFVGMSFMAFRLSHLVLEVRNRVVPMPGFWEYVGFAFFLPTMVVGPINPYSVHYASLAEPDRAVTPVGRSLLRILIGLAKYSFLGNIFNQLSYSGLLLDGSPHPPGDLLVAAVAYHLYLYCNFAGFCDIAIGAAGLLGIRVKENFQNPLAARSVQEYWTRWHITLSTYMRDVVFSPVSKMLIQRFGVPYANHAIALAIVVVFLLIGIWHGVGWNYFIHGALLAVAVATNHYYTVWLKRRLGKRGFQAYHGNRWISAAAIFLTFVYITFTLFFFANDLPAMKKIFEAIRQNGAVTAAERAVMVAPGEAPCPAGMSRFHFVEEAA